MLEFELSTQVLDCFFYVYRERGYGFLEKVYSNSLAAELEYRGVPVRREVPFELFHRGKPVGTYRVDLLVADRVLVEVKSTARLVDSDERQLLNCLKATPIEVRFLLHFGPQAKFLRKVLSNRNKLRGLAEPE
jgi:GxxExxY protein